MHNGGCCVYTAYMRFLDVVGNRVGGGVGVSVADVTFSAWLVGYGKHVSTIPGGEADVHCHGVQACGRLVGPQDVGHESASDGGGETSLSGAEAVHRVSENGGRSSDVATGGGDDAQGHGGDSLVDGKCDGQPDGKGRSYWRNRKKRERRRLRIMNAASWRGDDSGGKDTRKASVSEVRSTGYCRTIGSDAVASGSKTGVEQGVKCACGSTDTAVADAEMEARRTLAMRRTAENRVAAAKAGLLIASLNDKSKVAAYEELKMQRLAQRRNESLARSQASFEKCKSVDPDSSASQYDVRQQGKKILDMEAQCQALNDRLSQMGGLLTAEQRAEYERIKAVSPATEQLAWQEAQFWIGSDCGNGSNFGY